MKKEATIAKHTVANWKAQRSKTVVSRDPLTPIEIDLNLLIARSEARGRIGYMALHDLAMKNGKKPGWGAYATINEEVKELKAKIVVEYLKTQPDSEIPRRKTK